MGYCMYNRTGAQELKEVFGNKIMGLLLQSFQLRGQYIKSLNFKLQIKFVIYAYAINSG